MRRSDPGAFRASSHGSLEEPLTHRVPRYLALVLGLAAFGCGGEPAEEEPSPRATAGEEAPPVEYEEYEEYEEEEARPQAPPPRAETGATQISDEEVEAFADVTLELIVLEEQGMARVEAGEPVEQVQADLQPRVSEVFRTSVPDRAGTDVELRNRIQEELRDRVEEEAEEPV
jgi:hypothetical protein